MRAAIAYAAKVRPRSEAMTISPYLLRQLHGFTVLVLSELHFYPIEELSTATLPGNNP